MVYCVLNEAQSALLQDGICEDWKRLGASCTCQCALNHCSELHPSFDHFKVPERCLCSLYAALADAQLQHHATVIHDNGIDHDDTTPGHFC